MLQRSWDFGQVLCEPWSLLLIDCLDGPTVPGHIHSLFASLCQMYRVMTKTIFTGVNKGLGPFKKGFRAFCLRFSWFLKFFPSAV